MPHFKACSSIEHLYDLGAAEMVRQVGEVILFCLTVSSTLLFFLSWRAPEMHAQPYF